MGGRRNFGGNWGVRGVFVGCQKNNNICDKILHPGFDFSQFKIRVSVALNLRFGLRFGFFEILDSDSGFGIRVF